MVIVDFANIRFMCLMKLNFAKNISKYEKEGEVNDRNNINFIWIFSVFHYWCRDCNKRYEGRKQR